MSGLAMKRERGLGMCKIVLFEWAYWEVKWRSLKIVRTDQPVPTVYEVCPHASEKVVAKRKDEQVHCYS